MMHRELSLDDRINHVTIVKDIQQNITIENKRFLLKKKKKENKKIVGDVY